MNRWRFSALNLGIALALAIGLSLLVYPTAAAWVSQYNQSNVVSDQAAAVGLRAKAELERQLAEAREYNRLLGSGALLRAGAHLAEGVGSTETSLDYWKLLSSGKGGTMARLAIPSIEVDLPVYHGTSEATLFRGIGHLQGTSLPVGGQGTRAVLTGHRGLATATMFTDLDKVSEGDTFSVQVLDQVLTYRVFSIQVVEPEETEEIRAVPGRDLVTLVTCTPLGINTQRILLTGERVLPTPGSDLAAMAERPSIPAFPWWAIGYLVGMLTIGVWYWRAGYPSRRGNRRRRAEVWVPGVGRESARSGQRRGTWRALTANLKVGVRLRQALHWRAKQSGRLGQSPEFDEMSLMLDN